MPNVYTSPLTRSAGYACARLGRFGARFDVADAVSDYGGGRAEIVPPG